ncbi:MAG TPA: hypothetical protein VHZ74_27240 [Bryobacteraceae bacterium]|jgi:hypothetical protein|nr:hypothetical protein [Bryobacteraceae bacterium]
MTAEIDDQTTAYVLVAQTCFEDLKQVAGQLAGFLVLAAVGSTSGTPEHPVLKSAELVYRRAEDALKSLRVSKPARPHHAHLLRAAASLKTALSSTHRRRDFLPLLESAQAELLAASRALPGFQMLAFDRGCCAIRK